MRYLPSRNSQSKTKIRLPLQRILVARITGGPGKIGHWMAESGRSVPMPPRKKLDASSVSEHKTRKEMGGYKATGKKAGG
jgi:uncharacterized membrane protein YsdA (DUF1294 family)